MSQPTLQTASGGRVIGVVGDAYRFLVTGNETAGRYAQFEAFIPPGGGPPPHLHTREVEAFFVLEGEIAFTVNGEKITATKGMFANMPLGTPHSFKNESNRPARMLITVVPAGLEEMFFACGTPLPEGAQQAPPPSPADIGKLLELAPQYGVQILVPKTP